MEKAGIPVVLPESSEIRNNSKRHVLLTSWASVATALLLIILVGGAFYVAELKSRECTTTTTTSKSDHKTQDYTRTYEKEGEKFKEDIHKDEDEQSELIIKKSDGGLIELITAIDYKSKISATYVPRDDICLLLSGMDIKWVDDYDGHKNKTVNVNDGDVKESHYMQSGNKISDLSILPDVMKPYCTGKDTYWMQPSDGSTDVDHARQKRAACCICIDTYVASDGEYIYVIHILYYC